MSGTCPVCELVGRDEHYQVRNSDSGESAVGDCHREIVMELAEQFSDLPFRTIVDMLNETARDWVRFAHPPSEAALARVTADRLRQALPPTSDARSVRLTEVRCEVDNCSVRASVQLVSRDARGMSRSSWYCSRHAHPTNRP